MTAPLLFDRKLLLARRERALRLGAETFLLEPVAEELVERLSAVKRNFALALDLGTPGDTLIRLLKSNSQVAGVAANDLLANDEEAFSLPDAKYDLVVSALALQWVNDLPGALVQIRRTLKPDGLLLAALVGGETLHELRESFATAEAEITGGASPRVSPFAEVRSLGSLLQRAGYALPVIDSDRHTVRYETPFKLFQDLRRMGATNALMERSRKPLTKKIIARAAEIYTERFRDPDGRLRATFDILWVAGWVPHESQQKPLKPGSAKMRLADALGSTEKTTGEKPDR
ncbi:MAG TPA: methyltransferase domain-containing protein [Xanthobacteraceae bacterium]|jgi:SAM-dependent methyltransferase|nr:methyltransferase domain-containing protein [Xanthobacteraceae bacterium]